jgi:hypothetical protein
MWNNKIMYPVFPTFRGVAAMLPQPPSAARQSLPSCRRAADTVLFTRTAKSDMPIEDLVESLQSAADYQAERAAIDRRIAPLISRYEGTGFQLPAELSPRYARRLIHATLWILTQLPPADDVEGVYLQLFRALSGVLKTVRSQCGPGQESNFTMVIPTPAPLKRRDGAWLIETRGEDLYLGANGAVEVRAKNNGPLLLAKSGQDQRDVWGNLLTTGFFDFNYQ